VLTERRKSGDLGWKWNAAKEVGGFAAAEVMSVSVSIGAFTFVDEIAPSMMNKISDVIGKVCVAPFLDTIERTMQTVCKSKDCQVDPKIPRAERAKAYAHYFLRFGISAAAGLATEVAVRTGINHLGGIKNPASNLSVCAIDKSIHLGALALVNIFGAKQTDAMLDSAKDLLQKTLGWNEERSKKAADVSIRWEAANAFSAIITSLYMVLRQMRNRGRI
jgi:hypothetical protein